MSTTNTSSKIWSYAVGFLLSLVLTAGAFALVIFKLLDGRELLLSIVALAAVQLVVQLVFFLHLGNESRPRWNLIVFMFMLVVLVIIVAGSIWIMDNLDYHMMSRDETDTHMIHEADKGF